VRRLTAARQLVSPLCDLRERARLLAGLPFVARKRYPFANDGTSHIRFRPAECEQFGRTASAPESFRSNTGSGCRYIEGYSVGPAATRCLAAREQLLIAAKHGSASAGFNDSTTLASLRQSVTDEQVDVKKISAQIADERVDVKKMSAQISTLIAKVDLLQNAIAPEVTSSIPTEHARYRLSGVVRKRMARQPKPVGPVSVGRSPLSFPATTSAPQG